MKTAANRPPFFMDNSLQLRRADATRRPATSTIGWVPGTGVRESAAVAVSTALWLSCSATTQARARRAQTPAAATKRSVADTCGCRTALWRFVISLLQVGAADATDELCAPAGAGDVRIRTASRMSRLREVNELAKRKRRPVGTGRRFREGGVIPSTASLRVARLAGQHRGRHADGANLGQVG